MALLAGEEAIAQSGIGSQGPFPRPAVSRAAAARSRMAGTVQDGRDGGAQFRLSLTRTSYASRATMARSSAPSGSTSSASGWPSISAPQGSPISLNTACASGATAIQLGLEAIRRGECEAVLAIGADGSVTPESLVRFSLLSALSTQNDPPQQASKPFSKNRDGFVIAEGAAALVLESLEHAQARGARVLGIIEGCGEKSNSFHRTRSSPDGKPIIACMSNALADAGVAPDDVDYINAHGTSTPENDKMECLGVVSGVWRARDRHSDLVQQVDDRPHSDGGRRDRGRRSRCLRSNISAFRRPSTTTSQIRRFRSTSCPTRRVTRAFNAPSPIRSASAARTSAW